MMTTTSPHRKPGTRPKNAWLVRWLFWPVAGILLLLGLSCGYLLFIRLASEPAPFSNSEIMVDVVYADRAFKAGNVIDSLVVFQGTAPADRVPEGTFQHVEDVYGKYVRFNLEPGDFITADKVLDALTVDVLVTMAAVPQWSVITSDAVEVRTVNYFEVGAQEPLKGLDYYYLGQMVAVVPIEPGTTLSREMIAIEPLADYDEIYQQQILGSQQIPSGSPIVLPTKEQALDVSRYSLLGVLISFLLGIGFVFLLNRVFGR